jgi:WD40 repeat protein
LLCLTASAEQPELVVQTGHPGKVPAVAFSPDGRILASAGPTVKLWEVANGREVRELRPLARQTDSDLTDNVRCLAFSPDGRMLAGGSEDTTIKLWEVASGHQLQTFVGHRLPIQSIAFSPDGRILASGGDTIKLWDVTTGHELVTLAKEDFGVKSVAFSPDGRTLASGSERIWAAVWDVATGRLLRMLEKAPEKYYDLGSAHAIAFSADGRTLASENEGTIKFWDLATGREVRVLPASDWWHDTGYYVAFSSDWRLMVVGSDHGIAIWDVPSGRMLATGGSWTSVGEDVAGGRGLGRLGDKAIGPVALSRDGKTLASGTQDNAIKLWGVEDQIFTEPADTVLSLAFSPDGRKLASGYNNGSNTLWDVASGNPLQTFQKNGDTHSMVFSPDGRTLATGGGTTIQLWDVDGGNQLQTLQRKEDVHSMAFSSDGRTLASGGEAMIELWDVASGNQLQTLMDGGYSLVFSPDGTKLTSRGPQNIKSWEVANGHELRTVKGNALFTHAAVAFSSEGSKLVSGEFKEIKLWDATSGDELGTGETGWVEAVAFSADGKMVVAAGDAIKLWNVANEHELRELRTLREHIEERMDKTTTIAFSPDGRILASGEKDATIKLWDVASGHELRALVRGDGHELQTLAGHAAEFNFVALSADGQKLVTRVAGHEVKLWNIANGDEPLTLDPGFDAKSVAFSPNGSTLAGINGSTLQLLDLAGEGAPRTLGELESDFESLAFNSKGDILASGKHKIRIWNVAKGLELKTLAGHTGQAKDDIPPPRIVTLVGPVHKDGKQAWLRGNTIRQMELVESGGQASVISIAFSPDGHTLASGSDDLTIKLWDPASGQELRTLEGHSAWVSCLAFSPDSRILASGGDDYTVRLWDVGSGRPLHTMNEHTDRVMSVAFSPNGRILASAGDDGMIMLWDVASGRKLRMLPVYAPVSFLAFRPDGATLVSGSANAVILWDTATGTEVAAIFALDQGAHWLVASPDGYFDTDDLDDVKGLSWVFPDEPLRALSPEIFMRDYYKLRLLSKSLNKKGLPKVRPLQDLNRLQPRVDVLKVEPVAGDLVSVTVRVTGAESLPKDSVVRPVQGGAYDLRLFRDGQMVAQWPDVTTFRKPTADQGRDLELWRKLHQIDLVGGQYTHTFSGIHLPERSGGPDPNFTAYAFNLDRVKSLTSPPFEYTLPSAKAPRPRRAYLVTMGVNANESRNLNLELAVSSAEQVRSLLAKKLRAGYSEIVEIPLYSDLDADGSQPRLKTARKADLKAVLDMLAGRTVDPSLRDEVDPKHELRAARPDDAVVLYVASHGYADPQGAFYLMPYDTGLNWGVTEDLLTRCETTPVQSADCKKARDLLAHSVSSGDLAMWWSGVDAGQMVMILDSCHSGAVPGKEFRPGPLGDPGFGQLSYDKGMQILTASQPAQTEQGEWVTGGEGRTLLVDALEAVAKIEPEKTLDQWLQAVRQQLPRTARQLYPGLKEKDIQIPVLLDFARKPNTAAATSQ